MHGYNFGGLLQALATKKILEDHGHEVITLDYHPAKRMELIRQLTFNISTIHKFIGIWLDKQKFSSVSQFEDFRTNNFTFSPSCYSSKQLSKFCQAQDMDAVVVGSDQVWSADWIKPAYFIDFNLKNNCKRIALSACCGHYSENQKYLDYCGNVLNKFDAISVRNTFTAELVKRTTSRLPEIVCDPTLATNLPIAPVTEIQVPYALLYIINRSQNLVLAQKSINLYSKYNTEQTPVYSITPAELKGVETLKVDRVIYNITPLQWHYLIANANIVITDSFHGTIFSLKNHRNFAVLNKGLRTAGRFQSLLIDLGLEERIINCEDEIYKIQALKEYDWSVIDEKIEQMSRTYHDFVDREFTHSTTSK